MYFINAIEAVQLCCRYARNGCGEYRQSSIVGYQKHCLDHCHGSLGTTGVLVTHAWLPSH